MNLIVGALSKTACFGVVSWCLMFNGATLKPRVQQCQNISALDSSRLGNVRLGYIQGYSLGTCAYKCERLCLFLGIAVVRCR